MIIIPWYVPDHYTVHSAVPQLHLNKTGEKRKERKRVGTWPTSSGLGPTQQQGGLAGTELTKDLGGPKTPELHPPGFRN